MFTMWPCQSQGFTRAGHVSATKLLASSASNRHGAGWAGLGSSVVKGEMCETSETSGRQGLERGPTCEEAIGRHWPTLPMGVPSNG